MIDEKELYGLSQRQRAILRFIVSFREKKGYPPSIRDIGKGVGLSSSSTVYSHLNTLAERGFIHRDPSKPRAMDVLIKDRKEEAEKPRPEPPPPPPVAENTTIHRGQDGHVMCSLLRDDFQGRSIFDPANIEERFSLPEKIAGSPDAFLVRMTNDSMVEGGILKGDLCIIHPGGALLDGEIALVESGGSLTIKRVFRQMSFYRLEPQNRKMRPVYVKELVILGKVAGIIRSPLGF
jgi:repressor LexA